MHYDEPLVAEKTNDVLKAMRKDADALRLIFWFGIAADERESQMSGTASEKHLGMIASHDGEVSPRISANFVALLHEAATLGYARAFVVFGDTGKSSPKCNLGQYGGSYDRRDLAASWDIRKNVVNAIQRSNIQMPFYYDISPEACPGSALTPLMGTNLSEFTRFIIIQYAKALHDNHFFVSCGGGSVRRALGGQDSMIRIFRSLGVHPTALDAHIDRGNVGYAEDLLVGANADPRSLGVRVNVLEVSYDNMAVFSRIGELRHDRKLSELAAVGVFPNTLSAHCALSVKWPVSLGEIGRAMQ